MALYADQFTVSPSIPRSLLRSWEGRLLLHILDHSDDGDAVYLYAEDGARPELEDDDLLFLDLETYLPPKENRDEIERRLALALATYSDRLYLDEAGLDIETLLHRIVHRYPDQLPVVTIEGCWWCSKMRPGAFGGFATLIRPSGVQSIATHTWLLERCAA